jgi:uncharacterized repeat protein (TIGR01451 family)
MSETSPAPYSAFMSLMRSFRVGLWAPATSLLALGWSQSAHASEPVEPAAPEGATIAIETDTVAAVLGTRTLSDGTRVKEWLPATDIRQGQVVYYTVKIRNPAATAAHNVVVTRPVPANTRYVAESAAAPGAVVSFSIDGGKTFAPARELIARDARGIPRAVAPEAYTHIRWQMRYPLAPGAIAYARFRAVFR